MAKRKRYTEEKKMRILDEIQQMREDGMPMVHAVKRAGISLTSYENWKSEFSKEILTALTTNSTVEGKTLQLPVAQSSMLAPRAAVDLGVDKYGSEEFSEEREALKDRAFEIALAFAAGKLAYEYRVNDHKARSFLRNT